MEKKDFFGTPYWVGGGDIKYHKQLPFKYDWFRRKIDFFGGGGGAQKNITSYYPSNMINFGEKSIFLDTLLGEGGGGKKNSGFWKYGPNIGCMQKVNFNI